MSRRKGRRGSPKGEGVPAIRRRRGTAPSPRRSRRRCELCERFQPLGCEMVLLDDGLWWVCDRCWRKVMGL